MKKLIAIIALLITTHVCVHAKDFDSILNKFQNAAGAEYIDDTNYYKEPFESDALTLNALDIELPFRMKIELTGMKILHFDNCDKATREKIEEAVMKAAKKSDLIFQASGNQEDVSVWLSPKKAEVFDKMIVFDKNQGFAVLSGKFKSIRR